MNSYSHDQNLFNAKELAGKSEGDFVTVQYNNYEVTGKIIDIYGPMPDETTSPITSEKKGNLSSSDELQDTFSQDSFPEISTDDATNITKITPGSVIDLTSINEGDSIRVKISATKDSDEDTFDPSYLNYKILLGKSVGDIVAIEYRGAVSKYKIIYFI